MIGILGVIIFIYSIVGLVVGVWHFGNEAWPARKKTVVIPGVHNNYTKIAWTRTILFALICGPAFWFMLMFVGIFTLASKLLET